MEKPKENYKLSFHIDKWEKEQESNSKISTLIYRIDLESELSHKKWYVPRSIEDMKTLINNITLLHLNIPIPPKIFDLDETPDNILTIAKEFESYMQSLLTRSDIINSDIVSIFFELEKHLIKIDQYQSKKLAELPNVNQEISDMFYDETESLLFVACGKKLLTGFLDNALPYSFINMFTKEKIGQVLVYKIIPATSSMTMIEQVYEHKTNYEIGKLRYYNNHIKKYLIVAYYNGTMEVFECSPNMNISNSTGFLKSTLIIQVSKKQVLNFGFNSITNYIYAVGKKETVLHISFALSDKKTTTVSISDVQIISFEFDEKDNRVIAMNSDGLIIIANVINDINIETKYVLRTAFKELSLFKVDFELQRIHIGNLNGDIAIYSYKEINDKITYEVLKEYDYNLKDIPLINSTMTNVVLVKKQVEISEMIYNDQRKELLVGFSNGIINIYSHNKEIAESVLKYNHGLISKMIITSDSMKLIIGSHDQSLKIISLPKKWISDASRQYEEDGLVYMFNDNNIDVCENRIEEFKNKMQKIAEENKMTFFEKHFLNENTASEDDKFYQEFLTMKM